MKHLLFLCIFTTMSLVTYAQAIYRCTTNDVRVHTGPGANYPVLKYYQQGGDEEDAILAEGFKLIGDGQEKNGFIHVQDLTSHGNFGEGWVSAQYLEKLTKKCPSCDGRGHFNRPCDNCEGYGCWACADTDGKQRCEDCMGLGVVSENSSKVIPDLDGDYLIVEGQESFSDFLTSYSDWKQLSCMRIKTFGDVVTVTLVGIDKDNKYCELPVKGLSVAEGKLKWNLLSFGSIDMLCDGVFTYSNGYLNGLVTERYVNGTESSNVQELYNYGSTYVLSLKKLN